MSPRSNHGSSGATEPTRAERNIAWIETHLRIPERKFVSQPVPLREWQRTSGRPGLELHQSRWPNGGDVAGTPPPPARSPAHFPNFYAC